MLGQCCRQWPNIKTTSLVFLVFYQHQATQKARDVDPMLGQPLRRRTNIGAMSCVNIYQCLIVAWSHWSAKSILIICFTNMPTSPTEFCQGEGTKFDRFVRWSECTRRTAPSLFRHTNQTYESMFRPTNLYSYLRIYIQTYESIYLFHALNIYSAIHSDPATLGLTRTGW